MIGLAAAIRKRMRAASGSFFRFATISSSATPMAAAFDTGDAFTFQ